MANGKVLEISYTRNINGVIVEYNHIAPDCNEYKVSFADVDKEGSGRNSLTGEMFRERIGSYTMYEVNWNLIPDTKQYRNWYKILTHLPPQINAKLKMPSGEIVTKRVYRGDVSTSLYLWTDGIEIWQGLTTTFTQWDLDKYDDNFEPELEE